jgi:hypothetical protein|tara:strand:+ start:6676 stop:6969 length:294 start_codon:yes stop_codon:yes gene_type:complete
MSVDVQIYVSNFIKFFKDNPNELIGLIGKGDSEDFFKEVEMLVNKNHEKGEDLELTQKQLISIILKINEMNPVDEKFIEDTIVGPFMETSFGLVFLN